MADVAADLKTWSTTASSNNPSDSTTVGAGLADNLQEIQKVIRQDLAHKGADIASAGTTDLGAVAGLMHDITGTTTITSFGTVSAGIWKFIKFEGALTLTHNATSLILPGGANITTAVGDTAVVISEGSGNWRCLAYTPASGMSVSYPVTNSLYNGAFQVWQRGTASTSSPAATRTFLADRWYVNPAGVAVNQLRSTTIPTGSRAQYSLEIQGAAGVTTVLIGQRLIASDIPAIKRTVTFQAYVYNGSGASFQPSLLLGTPAASDNFTTVTNRLTQTLQACADASWTQVSHTVDISGYTNIDNGLQVEIQIPSGSLVAADTVRVTELQLAAISLVAQFETNTFVEEYMRCSPFCRKSFAYNTAPAQAAGGSYGLTWFTLVSGAVDTYSPMVFFEPPMRATPDVTTYNPDAANSQVRNTTDSADCSVTTAFSTTKWLQIRATQNAGGTAFTDSFAVNWLATAEP